MGRACNVCHLPAFATSRNVAHTCTLQYSEYVNKGHLLVLILNGDNLSEEQMYAHN